MCTENNKIAHSVTEVLCVHRKQYIVAWGQVSTCILCVCVCVHRVCVCVCVCVSVCDVVCRSH